MGVPAMSPIDIHLAGDPASWNVLRDMEGIFAATLGFNLSA